MFIEYLGRAKASAGELRAQLYLASDQRYITDAQMKEARELAEICGGQLVNLSRYLKSQPNSRRINEDGEMYNV